MLNLTIDLSKLNATQLAALEAALHEARVLTSNQKMKFITAGDANCGSLEYDNLYSAMKDAIRGVK